jgi:hypothetical protein
VREVYGITSGLVKWDDRSWNSSGEDGILDHDWWVNVSVCIPYVNPAGNRMERRFLCVEKLNETDAELRKHREQKGLETPVVYAVNDVHFLSRSFSGVFGEGANALNVPPGE